MERITQRKTVFETPWFTLQEKLLAGEGEPYYSLQSKDYVAVLAVSESGNVILVRQYRPAVECLVLELPAGHVEAGESPEWAARRELLEETGYRAASMELVGELVSDSGRLSNRQWCYFAPSAIQVSADREEGIEVIEMSPAEFASAIRNGEFRHSLHLSVVLMAVVHGFWHLPKLECLP